MAAVEILIVQAIVFRAEQQRDWPVDCVLQQRRRKLAGQHNGRASLAWAGCRPRNKNRVGQRIVERFVDACVPEYIGAAVGNTLDFKLVILGGLHQPQPMQAHILHCAHRGGNIHQLTWAVQHHNNRIQGFGIHGHCNLG